jgi:hypothetical protein
MVGDLDYWIDYFDKSANDMLPENFSLIKNHIRKMKAAKRSDQTLINHYQALTQFGKWCKIPFTKLTEDNILDYSDFLDRQTYSYLF